MAELRLVTLEDVLTKKQLESVERELSEVGVEKLPEPGDDFDLEESLPDDQLTDFMDRLDAHDLSCDLYLPAEFDGTFDVGETSVGSTYALLEALDELREELDIDEAASDDEEEEMDIEVIEEQLRFIWRAFLRAASTAIDRQVVLQVVS
jgi:hypothetical protein